MSFSGMIKLKFFKSMYNKISKIVSVFFHFRMFFFNKKRLHDTTHFNRQGRRKRKRDKENLLNNYWRIIK